MSEMKTCFRCKRSLPADTMHYHHDSGKKDHLTSACRECMGVEFTKPSTVAKKGYKFCSKCGGEFPLTNEYFMPRKIGKDGFRSQCRKCRMEKQNQHTNDNRDVISRKRREYGQRNKEVIAKNTKAFRQANKEACRLRKAKYYTAHKENIYEYGRIYYAENKEVVKKKNAVYRSKNRDICNILAMRYRSKKKNLPSTLTTKQWNEIKIHFDYRCAYCNNKSPLSRDHFFPLNKGGEFTRDNVIPACKSCNSSKQASDPFTWYPLQQFYSKQREQKILKHLGYNKLRQQQLSLI